MIFHLVGEWVCLVNPRDVTEARACLQAAGLGEVRIVTHPFVRPGLGHIVVGGNGGGGGQSERLREENARVRANIRREEECAARAVDERDTALREVERLRAALRKAYHG